MKPLIILLTLMLPGMSWAACFSEQINKLANSGKVYKAKVIANKKLGARSCELTLTISGTRIIGEATGRLCRTEKDATIKVLIHNTCCEPPTCKGNKTSKIWFTTPKDPTRAGLLILADHDKDLLEILRPDTNKTTAAIKSKPAQSRKKSLGQRSETAATIPKAGVPGGLKSKRDNTTTATRRSAPPRQKPPSQPLSAITSAPPSLDRYKVQLGVDPRMEKPGPPGELKVWIGDPALNANFDKDMSTAETTIAAVGQSAKVTPFAPDFEVTPKESICIKIHPSGSEARFALTPKATGTFKVGADVLLYASAACSGPPVPKSAASLKVQVVVNTPAVIRGYLLQLWEILWKGVLEFWGWLVGAIVSLLIFRMRKRFKWFRDDT